MTKIDELIKLNEERTQDFWLVEESKPWAIKDLSERQIAETVRGYGMTSRCRNAAFIAALANAAPALLKIADLASRLEEFGRDTPKELIEALEALEGR